MSSDRKLSVVEKALNEPLTPLEQPGFDTPMWYKREDKLTLGPVNGTKLRQLRYIAEHAKAAGYGGLLSAASVHSPQPAMVAVVAEEYAMESHVILGATKPSTARRHISVSLAEAHGANFSYIKVGYNPALRAAAARYASQHPEFYVVPYATQCPPDIDLFDFHWQTGAQATFPPHITKLVMAAGTCGTATSVMLGLTLRQHHIEEVLLVGVGPSKLETLWDRLAKCAGPGVAAAMSDRTRYVDIHALYPYARRVHFSLDGIEFHPTYEAKALEYLWEHQDDWPEVFKNDTVFWVTGAE